MKYKAENFAEDVSAIDSADLDEAFNKLDQVMEFTEEVRMKLKPVVNSEAGQDSKIKKFLDSAMKDLKSLDRNVEQAMISIDRMDK